MKTELRRVTTRQKLHLRDPMSDWTVSKKSIKNLAKDCLGHTTPNPGNVVVKYRLRMDKGNIPSRQPCVVEGLSPCLGSWSYSAAWARLPGWWVPTPERKVGFGVIFNHPTKDQIALDRLIKMQKTTRSTAVTNQGLIVPSYFSFKYVHLVI